MKNKPVPAESIPAPEGNTVYPKPFSSIVEGRVKRKLGNYFGLTNFGINLTQLEPGSASALLHHHLKQDEFIYILQGTPTLLLNDEEYVMKAGDCHGVKAGEGIAAQLINKSQELVVYIEVGDRTAGDEVDYPNDDLKAKQLPSGEWRFSHNDGRPY